VADAETIQDACPVCGAMLADDDERCPRCGADVSRDRTLREAAPASAEAPLPDPERAQGGREDKIQPPENRDYRERKPAFEAGQRPPVPDDD
jgi:rRNA maturation protein Nop10